MAKKKTEDTINLDSILFKCRDILRAARNSGSFFEKRDMMLTLVFLRFIGENMRMVLKNYAKSYLNKGLTRMMKIFVQHSLTMPPLRTAHIIFHLKQDGLPLSILLHQSLMLH